jgi:hypothetical protein
MDKYAIEAGSTKFIVSHNFYGGFTIKASDGEVIKRGMPLGILTNKLTELCKAAGAVEVKIIDLRDSETETVKTELLKCHITW